MPPWPAGDWPPAGQRGDALALRLWGVAVRGASRGPSRARQGPPLPGLASVRHPRPRCRHGRLPGSAEPAAPTAGGAASGRSGLRPLSPRPGCPALGSGDWRVGSSLGSGQPCHAGGGCAGAGCGLRAGAEAAPRALLSLWPFADWRWEKRVGCAFRNPARSGPALRPWSLPVTGAVCKRDVESMVFSSPPPSRDDSALDYVLFGLFCFVVFGY